MLSLKDGALQHVQSSRSNFPVSRLLDLPSELLDFIIELVGRDDYRTETLCPLSLTCTSFRQPAQTLLFKSVNLVLSRRFTRKEETFSEWLLCRPRIRSYIKHVAVRAPLISVPDDDIVECRDVIKLLSMLPNLGSLWLHNLNWVTFPIMKAVQFFNQQQVHLTIAGAALLDTQPVEVSCISTPEVISSLKHCASISIGVKSPVAVDSLDCLKNVLSNVKCARAVKIVDSSADARIRHNLTANGDTPLSVHNRLSEIKQQPAWGTLEELQLDSRFLLPIDGYPHWTTDFGGANIKRLSVQGHEATFGLILNCLSSLESLISLKYRCSSPYTGMGNTQVPKSPFARLVNLRELELEQVNIPLAYCANANVKKLKLHSTVSIFRLSTEQATERLERTPAELSSLGQLFPLLEHLEIDIGDMSKLWHPTAIPGVDVDVVVYGALNALTRLNLTTLRLFPSYLRGYPLESGSPVSRLSQPLNDEQAIKVFNYLKSQSHTLQHFAISTDNEFMSASRRFDFHAMSWTIHKRGSLTILITRQALRDYEQKQVWVGERKLTTEIRRFAYLKPYVPGSCDWIIPPSF